MLRSTMSWWLSLGLAALVVVPAWAGSELCALARFESDEAEQAYVEQLRAEGPTGLQKAFQRLARLQVIAAELETKMAADEKYKVAARDSHETATEGCRRISDVIDRIAGQRDATASRLYWYTDFEQAKRAAAESGQPILSLRMLGKLTDEFSCANSRFFRTALYANKEISDYLRDNFVLHWQSVRPVPRVTVDFGDGRTLERTITGNSAHYVLDAHGRPVDVLPGLYGPQAFRAWLVRTKEFADRLAPISSDVGRERLMSEFHTHRRLVIEDSLRADLAAVAPKLLDDASLAPSDEAVVALPSDGHPTALKAGARAVSKYVVEVALVAPFAPNGEVLNAQNENFWRAVADRHLGVAVLDESSRSLVSRDLPQSTAAPKVATAVDAGQKSISKGRIEDPLLRMVMNFQQSMALDTVKNEYTLHRQIHDWFAAGQTSGDVDALNERVYAELFLTPSSDPWLGLAPGNVYTALDRGGLTETQAAK